MLNHISIISNSDTNEFFVSNQHCDYDLPGFVPVTYSLPMEVAPRETLPSGIVKTLEDVIGVFYSDMKKIENPQIDVLKRNSINIGDIVILNNRDIGKIIGISGCPFFDIETSITKMRIHFRNIKFLNGKEYRYYD